MLSLCPNAWVSLRLPKVGTLLSDHRRVNVLLSRAKCKLLVVGSATTLAAGKCASAQATAPAPPGGATRQPSFNGGPSTKGRISAEMMKLLRSNQWVHALPAGAHLKHSA